MLNDNLDRSITVKKLRKLLKEINSELILMPNALGNLAILNHKNTYIGYIDLGSEKVEFVR